MSTNKQKSRSGAQPGKSTDDERAELLLLANLIRNRARILKGRELSDLLLRVKGAIDEPTDPRSRMLAYCSSYQGRGPMKASVVTKAAHRVAAGFGDAEPALRAAAEKAVPQIGKLVQAFAHKPRLDAGRPPESLMERIAVIVGTPSVDDALKELCGAMKWRFATAESLERVRYRAKKK